MKLRILEICKQAGITQKELAERIGLSAVGLSKAINGNPTKDTLEKIASALNVRITELFEEPTNINGYIELDGTIHKVTSKDDIKKLAEKL
jgi:transcriptional regulator with XRE-family HTH domain